MSIYDAGFNNLLTRELETPETFNTVQPSQIIAGSLDLGQIQILPDENTGLVAKDDDDSNVFKIITGGTDVGDVIMGDYTGNEGIKYDKSASSFLLSLSSSNAITIQYGSDILLQHGGDIKFTSVTKPIACTGALAGVAGNIDNGDHYYAVTYVNTTGETELGTASNTVTVVDKTSNGQISLTGIPLSSSGSVTSRKIYRTKAGGNDYYLLTTIANNTATTYTDNTADASLTGGIANDLNNDSFGKILIDNNVALRLETYNTFVGILSGNINSTGSYNTGLGRSTLAGNNTGYGNTAIGSVALITNSTGYQNTAVGAYALNTNNENFQNTAVGYYALRYNTGDQNTAIGVNALTANTSGNNNTAIGYIALESGTTGHRNTAIGSDALKTQTTTSDNTAIGYRSLEVATGTQNVAVGAYTLTANTTGYSSVALGQGSLDTNTTGDLNTAIGDSSLYTNLSGNNNTAIGKSSLFNNSTGSGNIGIGAFSGLYETGSDAFYINNQDRTNTAGDKAKSLLYGVMNADQTLQKLQINANLKIGAGDVRATTVGTRVFDIFDGTAPAGTLANGISLYSTAGELRVMDAAGTATLLSSHSKKTGEWIHDSYNVISHKRLIVQTEKMAKFIDKKFGTNFVEELYD